MVLGVQESGHWNEVGAGGDDSRALAHGQPHVAHAGAVHSHEQDSQVGLGIVQVHTRANAQREVVGGENALIADGR